MTRLVDDTPYIWPSASTGVMLGASDGGSCDLLMSLDNGLTFDAVGSLPLSGGELQAIVDMRNCVFKVVNIVGAIDAKPDVKIFNG